MVCFSNELYKELNYDCFTIPMVIIPNVKSSLNMASVVKSIDKETL